MIVDSFPTRSDRGTGCTTLPLVCSLRSPSSLGEPNSILCGFANALLRDGRKRRMLLLPWLLSTVALSGCSSCGKDSRQGPEAATQSLEIAPGSLEPAWTWKQAPAGNVAVPAGCRLVSAPHRHLRDTRDLFFFAAEGDTTTLAVASGDRDPGEVTRSRGLITLGIESPGAVRDLPWLHLLDPPVMASSSKGWIALIEEPDAFTSKVRVWMWREGGRLDVLAEGDRLAAVDARCEGDRCVVLTTRVAEVATAGATLWKGDPSQPSSAWTRSDVTADKVASGSTPVGIARWGDDSALLAFDGQKQVAFVRVRGDGVVDEGKVDRGVVLLDVVGTRDAKVAVMTRGEPDEQGCVAEGAQVELAAVGHPPTRLPSSVPPSSGYARRLGAGAFVTWAVPVNCRIPERKVVYGLLMGPDGSPISTTMALGNADGHAVATRGDEVHVWLSDATGVTWVRAKCSTQPSGK